MNLSISSSNQFRFTVILFCLMALSLGTVKGYLLGDLVNKFQPVSEIFWYSKAHQDQAFDMVLVGDSRVYRGLSPEVIQSCLDGASVLNHAYDSAGLNGILLSASEGKLKRDGLRVIVLGVSPYSLTEDASMNKHLSKYLQQNTFHYYANYFDSIFSSRTTDYLIRRVLLGELGRFEGYVQLPHSDGWVESDFIPANQDKALEPYRLQFAKNKVSAEVSRELFAQINAWTDKGITVIGFRPPTTIKMEALENEMSGFSEDEFVRRFTESGGCWIDIKNRYEYQSYDGSHLNSRSARLFSAYIGKKISDHLSSLSQTK